MEELKKIVSKVLNIDANRINDRLSRDNTEEWDSFNHLMLISEIEKKIKVKFTMPEVARIRTFRELQESTSSKMRK